MLLFFIYGRFLINNKHYGTGPGAPHLTYLSIYPFNHNYLIYSFNLNKPNQLYNHLKYSLPPIIISSIYRSHKNKYTYYP